MNLSKQWNKGRRTNDSSKQEKKQTNRRIQQTLTDRRKMTEQRQVEIERNGRTKTREKKRQTKDGSQRERWGIGGGK